MTPTLMYFLYNITVNSQVMPLAMFITVDSQVMPPVMSITVDSQVMLPVMFITVDSQFMRLFMSKYQFVMFLTLDFESHVASHLQNCYNTSYI